MIGHQAVRVKRARPSLAERAQCGQIDKPIGVLTKTMLPIVAALPDMECYAGKRHAMMARHGDTTARAAPRLTVVNLTPN